MKTVTSSITSNHSINNKYRGRFAPSPTGYLHLGNIWVALISRCAAKQANGTWILRIEDIDRERCRDEYVEAVKEDLLWLGLTWDEEPYFQSRRYHIYEQIIEILREAEKVYPCYCNRARVQKIMSAPHPGEPASAYDGHCRQNPVVTKKNPSWRWKQEERMIRFVTRSEGLQMMPLRKFGDDIVLQRADGNFNYQFAVSVDDGMMDITEVVRGSDLYSSTGIQVQLLEYLGHTPPVYFHVPLLTDKEGIRLSKRQHGITVRECRNAGKTPEQVLGQLAYYAGINPDRAPMRLQEITGIDLKKWNLQVKEIKVETEE